MNSIDSFFNILGMIVTLAMLTVVVTSPNTAGIINAFGSTFSNSIKAATLQG